MPATADSQSSVRHRRRRPGAARACVTALVALAGCVSVFEGTSAAIAANVAVDLILTAGLSSIIDSANGADNKYDSVVNVSLATLPAPQAPATPQVTK